MENWALIQRDKSQEKEWKVSIKSELSWVKLHGEGMYGQKLRPKGGSWEVDYGCSDMISMADIMIVSFLFIFLAQWEHSRQIGFQDLASGQWGGLLKDHYHLLPLQSRCSGGITLVMRPTWNWLLAASLTYIAWRHCDTHTQPETHSV